MSSSIVQASTLQVCTLFFLKFLLWLLKRVVHWKRGACGKLGREGQFMDGAVDGFYVAFLYELIWGLFCCVRQHMNAQMIELYLFLLKLVSLRLASRLHIQNVNPEPTHFLPPVFCFVFFWSPMPHMFPQSKPTEKVSSEYVTNSMCVCARV